ncbi:MAG: hypothetical protein MR270_07050 [Erysipelotrichaceae bacterium]|nr:hypothetical protein [Erysipelotrichaceae bacterium]
MNYNWINKEFKELYCDNYISGVKLIVNSNIPKEINDYLRYVVNWVRKRYYFPIRYIINFKNNEFFVDKNGQNKTYDDFYIPNLDKFELPISWISTHYYLKEFKKYGLSFKCKRVLFQLLITHMTYYYQWYFFDDKNRSQRTNKTEITKMLNFLWEELNS